MFRLSQGEIEVLSLWHGRVAWARRTGAWHGRGGDRQLLPGRNMGDLLSRVLFRLTKKLKQKNGRLNGETNRDDRNYLGRSTDMSNVLFSKIIEHCLSVNKGCISASCTSQRRYDQSDAWGI